MNLVKYDNFWNDPFADLDNLMNRVFGGANLPALFDARYVRNGAAGGFRLDSYADDDAYYVVAELPGVAKDAIDVRLENAVLTISGERKSGTGENERRFSFRRSVTLGDDIQGDGVSARYEDGLLTVTLPKAEERKPRAIAVS